MTSVSPRSTARLTESTRRALERSVDANDLRDEPAADVDDVDGDSRASSEIGERGVGWAMNDARRRRYGDRNRAVRRADENAGRAVVDADNRAGNDRMGARSASIVRVLRVVVAPAVPALRRIGERETAARGRQGRSEQNGRKPPENSHTRLMNANVNRLVPFAT